MWLERVEVRGVSGAAAKVVGVDVELRDRRRGYLGGGLTEVVTRPRRDCDDRRTFVPLEGYVIEPGDDPLLPAASARSRLESLARQA